MGTFKRSEMLYDDGKYYVWKAKDGNDNPNYIIGTDRAELNRTEGYEVLPFINNFGDRHWSEPVFKSTYQKIEKMIRYDVPSDIRTHEGISRWIVANWTKVKFPI